MESVEKFTGQYSFLSNFDFSPFEEDGDLYFTVEHYFQSKKTCQAWEARLIRNAKSPAKAKRLGRRCSLRKDWETIKDSIMETALRLKFDQNRMLKAALLATGSDELVEGNRWGDTYWGVNIRTGGGLNRLGLLLMKIRKEYQEDLDEKRNT